MRIARQHTPGVVYHVISRFVDRVWLIRDQVERNHYLHLLGRALTTKSDWLLFSYALMSSHIHLGLVAGELDLESWAKPTHSAFAQWMNKRYSRLGSVMAERPASYAMYPDKEAELIAYIHNNPVRAGVVTRARHSAWTSHRAYLGTAPCPPWLHVGLGLARVGTRDPDEFDTWINSTAGVSGEVEELQRIRREVRRRGGVELATPAAGVVQLVARPFARVRPDPRRIVDVVADLLNVSAATICSRRRNEWVLAARRVTVHCAVTMGLTNADIARALGVSPQAVGKIAARALEQELTPLVSIACERVLEPGASIKTLTCTS